MSDEKLSDGTEVQTRSENIRTWGYIVDIEDALAFLAVAEQNDPEFRDPWYLNFLAAWESVGGHELTLDEVASVRRKAEGSR